MTPAARRNAALFLLTTALFTLGFAVFLRVQPQSDLTVHLEHAEEMRSVTDIDAPHFLLQVIVRSAIAAGANGRVAFCLLLGACYGGMARLVAREMDRRRVALTTGQMLLLIPAVLMASHIFLFTLARRNMYYGYFVPIVYHNPTQQLGKLFALWIWFEFSAQFVERWPTRWSRAALLGVLCVLSALSKPSFLIAFLPLGGVVGLLHLMRRRWTSALQMLLGIAVPSIAVLLWQARLAYGADVSSELLFAPFAVFDPRQTILKLPASLALPLVVWLMARRARALDARTGWTILFTAIALFYTLFLAEAGRVSAGNFAWTGQTAVFLAYVEAVLLLLSRPWPAAWRYVAWTVFGAHVLCGVIWYAAGFFSERVSFL